jgi:hypothetical protein
MSDNIEYIDVDSDEFYDAPKALREAYRKLKDARESDRKELNSLRQQGVDQALTDVLSGFKSPAKVKRDLLADGINAHDSKAVEQWLSANGDDYARGQASAQPEPPVVPDEERLAHEQLNVGSEFKQPADLTKLQAVQAEAGANPTGEQLIALFQKHGM